MSIEDLALKAHVSDVTISHIENGRVEPRPSTVRRLARALKVPPQELMQQETGDGKQSRVGLSWRSESPEGVHYKGVGMPKFRILSDPAEQLVAYQSDRRSKPALMPPEVPVTHPSVEPSSHRSERQASHSLHAHRLVELRERWRALHRKSAKALKGASRTRIAEKLRLLHARLNDLVDDEDRCHLFRHLVMRWSLGAVLAWFAVQQLSDPEAWTDFVPSFMPDVVGLPEATLIRLHGSLLLLASVGLLAGIHVRLAAGLAATILVQVIAALSIDGGQADLVARDVGLLGLALGLVFDPTRALACQLSGSLVALPTFRRRSRVLQPMVDYATKVAGAGFAARTHAGKGPAVSEVAPIGNGHVYANEELPTISETELIARQDEHEVNTAAGVNFPGELSRNDADLNDQHMLRLNEMMARFTWLLAGLTVLNLIAAIVSAVAAIVVIDRGG
jgi:transcriptional regulator with XRE-family HTH domain